jgi:predicted nucleic acid-binding protein
VAVTVLDASVVIGFLSSEDAHHDAAEAAFGRHREDELVLPASVYAEILVGPFRIGAAAVAKVDSFLTDFSIRIASVDAETAKRAAELRSRHQSLRLPDALVLATAATVGASKVLTADRSWTRISSVAEVI